MKQKELNELRELIADYVDQYPYDKKSDLAERILTENTDISLSHRSIRRYVSLAKKEAALRDEVVDSTDTQEIPGVVVPFMQVEEDTIEAVPSITTMNKTEIDPFTNNSLVTLTYRGGDMEISLRTIDRVFCAYSRKGLNLTGPIVRTLLNISNEEFSAITSKMDLNKESTPYSSVIKNILSEEDLKEYLAENTSYVLDLLYKHDGTVATELVRAYKTELVKMKNQDLYTQSLFKSLEKGLPEVNIEPLKASESSGGEMLHVIIPDLHIGLNQPNYNNAIVEEKFKEVLGILELTNASNVHVTFMGDIIHSVSGMNHQDSWKNMDPAQTGANAIIKPYELLLNFLAAIPRLVKVNIVGGNHDRMQSSKNQENTAEGAKLIAYMLRKSLRSIPVEFSSSYVVDDDDPNMCMIYLHGDNPLDKESVQTLSWNFGNPDKFNYVITAHMHSRKMEPKNDGLRYRKEQIEAFCPSDDYAKTLTAGSMPGFKLITCGNDKAPVTVDISLSYD